MTPEQRQVYNRVPPREHDTTILLWHLAHLTGKDLTETTRIVDELKALRLLDTWTCGFEGPSVYRTATPPV